MRPKITPCHNITHSLKYNEEKVTQKKAECLVAANFLKRLHRLSFEDKLHCFKKRMELNDRVTTNQHITLNFDPLDTLSNDKMRKIAVRYMKEIGFERQPYLVYRHNDAGHPHCHIVATHVQRDGTPIEMFNMGKNQSEKARLHIEAEYGLVTPEMKRQSRRQMQQPDGISKIIYGERSTAQSMSRVLEHVTANYKYCSFMEFNAILRLYNLEAYRGKEGSQLYQRRGLLYRVLDANGRYIGVPLKASFFDCKPTLDNLEMKFALHQSQKQQFRRRVSVEVQMSLLNSTSSLKSIAERLSWQQIQMILLEDKAGKCKEVTYIDLLNKCIFTGDELGKDCNAKAIQDAADRHKTWLEEQAQWHTQRQAEHQDQPQRLRHSLHL